MHTPTAAAFSRKSFFFESGNNGPPRGVRAYNITEFLPERKYSDTTGAEHNLLATNHNKNIPNLP